jgi:predicted dehydrogenase
MSSTIGVGLIGHAFMGKSHSHAWRNVHRFFDLDLDPRMVAIAGRDPAGVAAAAEQFGWESYTTDWRELLEREDLGIIDICTPGSSHAEMAIAALQAGKHVLCEKPLANTVEEAEAMVAAAAAAREDGVLSMVAFNYRRVPAVALARELIRRGDLGQIRHVRAVYLQDWLVDPVAPLVWRLESAEAGSGALGDIGAHIIDLAQFLLDDTIAGVSGLTETFIPERPLPDGSGIGTVTVDDAAAFVARFASGPIATFEASRFATGRKNGLKIEVNGSEGSLVFDLERLNELRVFTADGDLAGFRTVLVTEESHPYISAWWPPGHVIGWEHTFVHEVRDLLAAISEGTDVAPDFAAGLQVQRVLSAVLDSADKGAWIDV